MPIEPASAQERRRWVPQPYVAATQSPPLPHNFETQPVVTEGAYEYSKREIKVV